MSTRPPVRPYRVWRGLTGDWRVLCRHCLWSKGYSTWVVAWHALYQHDRHWVGKESANAVASL